MLSDLTEVMLVFAALYRYVILAGGQLQNMDKLGN